MKLMLGRIIFVYEVETCLYPFDANYMEKFVDINFSTSSTP